MLISEITELLRFLADIAARFLKTGPVVFGVVRCSCPELLRKYPDYTSLRKARHCKEKYCVLYLDSVELALKKCDFVIAHYVPNCKVIDPADSDKIACILDE